MKELFLRKELVIVTIILFLGAIIQPVFSSSELVNRQTSNDNLLVKNDLIEMSLGRDTPPVVEWQETYGGSEYDRAYTVQQTSDDGYFIVGVTNSYGSSDEYEVYLIKTDEDGETDWSEHGYSYGTALGDMRYVGWQTSDGGYIVCGSYQTSQTKSKVYLLKIDSDGVKVWENTFQINDVVKSDSANMVQQTNDGQYIVTGGTRKSLRNDVFLLKVYSGGSKNWQKVYGTTGKSRLGNWVEQRSDNGYILDGLYLSGTDGDYWAKKTDSSGNGQGEKYYGGTGFDIAHCIQQTSDGGFIMVGQFTQSDGDVDIGLFKLTSSLTKSWRKDFDKYGERDIGFCVRQTDDDGDGDADDGYIISGMTVDGSDDVDAWIIKTDSSGSKEWDLVLGDSDPQDAQSVWQTSDGGYIVAGYSNQDVWLTKLRYNEAPNTPSNPDPEDGETGVDLDADLSWTCTDPDGDDLTYDVYFGTTNPPPYEDTVTTEVYDPGTMEFGTTYYWKIVAEDEFGEETEGPVWDFVTVVNNPPNTPSNPDPEDGETGVNLEADLSWTGGDPDGDSVTYDVYFGTSSPPPQVSYNQSATTYDPDTMINCTTYYWKIVAWDEHGLSNAGDIWDFYTYCQVNNPPYEPDNPDPEDGETGVDLDADLSWTGGDPDPGDTVTYDVYFGTSSPPPLVSIDQTETTYDPGTMELCTKYYWKIIAEDEHGAETEGSEWEFTTICNNPPNKPTTPSGPITGVTGVLYTYKTSAVDPDSDKVKYGWDWDGDSSVDQWDDNGGSYYNSGVLISTQHSWSKEGTYYIRVIAEDINGAQSVWSNPLTVTIPKNKAINFLFSRFLQNHPNMFPILRQLLGL
jgi:hypothetical protein